MSIVRPWLQNNTLMQLNVGYNEIYNDGAWELAEAVGDNTGLQGLDLQRNEITDEVGAASCSLVVNDSRLSVNRLSHVRWLRM